MRGLSNPLHPAQRIITEWKTGGDSPQGSSNDKTSVKNRNNLSKQSQTRIDPRQIDDLIVAYRSGNTIKELAAQFQIHHTTVSNVLKRYGVPRRNRPLTTEQVELVIEAYQAGGSSKMIGDLFGVDASTVWRTLTREGVKTRDSHGRSCQHKNCRSARMSRIRSESPSEFRYG